MAVALDFKKNLDSKTLLLEEAESLAAEEDVITAYRRLQELHNKWRRIGPVAKELRDEIWDKFKAASAIVNKRYQAHFEERKAREAEAEAAKEELCAQVEAIDIESLNGFSAWDKATATIQELQGRWREMGFASLLMPSRSSSMRARYCSYTLSFSRKGTWPIVCHSS